ncbi:MAG: hypothetical protein CL916_14700 [Deltaproteobacteria bacterium]|nr:hypothetical protein [Deltaproteobacteria bacterium]
MRLSFFIRSFIWPTQLKVRQHSPRLSLTSQDGAWIRTEDFLNRRKLILLFVSDPRESKQLQWLSLFDNMELDTANIFAISPINTKTMREFRDDKNLHIDILYDPLSIEARRFGMSKRRLISSIGAVVIDEQQNILFSQKGFVNKEDLFALLQEKQTTAQKSDAVRSEEALELMKQGHILIDVRTRSEYEAHHSPDAIHIPIEELSAKISSLPQKSKLIFICQAGERAVAAAELLRSVGSTEVFVVAGGMTNWNGPQQHGVS